VLQSNKHPTEDANILPIHISEIQDWAFSITYAKLVVAIPAAMPMQKLENTGRCRDSKPIKANNPQAIIACLVGEFIK